MSLSLKHEVEPIREGVKGTHESQPDNLGDGDGTSLPGTSKWS